MKRVILSLLGLPVLCLPLALAACSDPAPSPQASSTPSMAPIVSESEAFAPPVMPSEAADAATSAQAPAEATFPEAMRGRWGMNAVDCDLARADNKGLMTVGPKSVKFYESVGEIGSVAERSGTTLRATFNYAGEGMEWKRDARFELADGGKTLILNEYGDDAPQGPRRHSKCA